MSDPTFQVLEAVTALRNFGDDLTREQAESLLSMWAGRHTLTADQMTQVLDEFPTDDTDERGLKPATDPEHFGYGYTLGGRGSR